MRYYSSVVIRSSSFYLLLLLSLVMGACSEQVKPHPPTYSQLLTGEISKTWRMVNFSLTIKEGEIKYEIPLENDCTDSVDYYDNYYTFYANAERTMEISEGPGKCSFHEEYSLVDYWAIENASATLSFVFLPFVGEYRVPWIIKDLTERKLVIEFHDGDKYIYQYVLNPVND